MLKQTKKILFLTNIPSPYRVDFFNEFGKSYDLTVAFQAHSFAHRHASWKNFEATAFHPLFLTPSFRFKKHVLCWDVLDVLKQPWDAIIMGGYSSLTDMLAIEYMRLRKIPFYFEADGGLIRQDNKLKFWFKRHFLSAPSGWLSSGKETTKYLIHYGADPNKIIEYPFTSVYAADILSQIPAEEHKQKLRQVLNIKEEKVLISVGRFIYSKGYDVLFKTVTKLPKDIGVYIIGDEPTEEFIRWKQEKNSRQVHFIGFQLKDELKKWYQAADAFVLPTREDVWGLVINEAMAQGLPIITTDKCVAGLELVQEGENGYIVPAEDVTELTGAIARLFAQDYRAMGQKSLELIRPYTIENMAKRHLEVFYGNI